MRQPNRRTFLKLSTDVGGAVRSRHNIVPKPALARLLAGHRDEAEVADRSAISLRVPVEHNYALSTPRSSQRMGETTNA